MVVCFSFRRMGMRELVYLGGKIFGIVDIHFGKMDIFWQKLVFVIGAYYEGY